MLFLWFYTKIEIIFSFQRQDVSEQEEDDTWEQEQPQTETQQETDMKPVWITDSKNNIKYAITHVNYSQVRLFWRDFFNTSKFQHKEHSNGLGQKRRIFFSGKLEIHLKDEFLLTI